MKRRTLLGLGATLGGAAMIGTNAFSSVRADRRVNVEVVGDGSALLRLEPCSNDDDENGDSLHPSDFVTTTESGTIAIDLTEGNDKIDKGKGITEDSLWRVPNAFRITNAGTQSVCVDLGFADGVPEIKDDGEAMVLTEKREYHEGDPAVIFYPGTNDSDEARIVPKDDLDTTDSTAIHLEPSDSQCIGFNIRTFGLGPDSEELEDLTLLIRADAGDECKQDEDEESPPGPAPIDGCPVTLDLDDLGPEIDESPPSGLGPDISIDANDGLDQGDDDDLCIGGNCDDGEDEDELEFERIENESEDGEVKIQPEDGQTVKIEKNVETDGGEIKINTADEESGTVKIGGKIETAGGAVKINTGDEKSGTVKIGEKVNAQADQNGNDGGEITVRGAEIGGPVETDGEIKINDPGNIDSNDNIDRAEIGGKIVSTGGGGEIKLGKADTEGEVRTDGQADITIVDAEVGEGVESNGGEITVGDSDNDDLEPDPSKIFGDIVSTGDGEDDGGDITVANVELIHGDVTSSGGDGGSGGEISINGTDNVDDVPRTDIDGSVTSTGGESGGEIKINKGNIGSKVTTKGQNKVVIIDSHINGRINSKGSIKLNEPDDSSSGEIKIAGNVRTGGESDIDIDAHDTSNNSVRIDGLVKTNSGDININSNIDDEADPGSVDIAGLVDAGGGAVSINTNDDAVGTVNIGGDIHTKAGDDGDSVDDITIRSATVCGSIRSIGGDEASGGSISINDPDNIDSEDDVNRAQVGGKIVSTGEEGGGEMKLGKADVGGAVTTDGQADITIVDAEVGEGVESNGGEITVGDSDNDDLEPEPSEVFGDIVSTGDDNDDGGDITVAKATIDGNVEGNDVTIKESAQIEGEVHADG